MMKMATEMTEAYSIPVFQEPLGFQQPIPIRLGREQIPHRACGLGLERNVSREAKCPKSSSTRS
jgi:hypothetical protein